MKKCELYLECPSGFAFSALSSENTVNYDVKRMECVLKTTGQFETGGTEDLAAIARSIFKNMTCPLDGHIVLDPGLSWHQRRHFIELQPEEIMFGEFMNEQRAWKYTKLSKGQLDGDTSPKLLFFPVNDGNREVFFKLSGGDIAKDKLAVPTLRAIESAVNDQYNAQYTGFRFEIASLSAIEYLLFSGIYEDSELFDDNDVILCTLSESACEKLVVLRQSQDGRTKIEALPDNLKSSELLGYKIAFVASTPITTSD